MENNNMIHEEIEMCKIEELELKLSHVNEALDILTDEYERLENAIKAMDDVENILFGNMDNMSGWLEFRETHDKLEDEKNSRSRAISKYEDEYYNITRELNPLIDAMYKVEA